MDTSSKRWVLVGLILLALLSGVVLSQLPEGSSPYRSWRLFDLVLNWLLQVFWFVVDAKVRRISLRRTVAPIWFLLMPIGPVIYFWKTRGKDKWKSLFKSVGFAFVLAFFQLVGKMLAAGVHSV
jgi:hypothetical protein